MAAASFTATSYGPLKGGKPKQLVVLLHGVSHDGSQMMAVAPELAKAMPEAEFLCIDAPYAYDGAMGFANPGEGRQWFSLKSPRIDAMWLQVMRTSGLLNQYIDAQLKQRGLDDRQLAIMGFSQGAITGVYAALRRDRPCAAVVSHSGRFAGFVPMRSRPWALVIHGEKDETIPVESFDQTTRALQNAKVPVWGLKLADMAHELRPAELAKAAQFMAFAFEARAATPEQDTPGWLPDPAAIAVRIRDAIFGAPKREPAAPAVPRP